MSRKEMLKFLNYEILSFTIKASITRGNKEVYRANISENKRDDFRKFLKDKLLSYARMYRDRYVDSEQHIRNIQNLADEVTSRHKSILREKRFNIGRAQKLLNLYLKYLWTVGKMDNWKTKMPPHCPFDYKVVNHLRKIDPSLKNWTELVSVRDYKNYLRAAEEILKKSKHKSLAEWELDFYNKAFIGKKSLVQKSLF